MTDNAAPSEQALLPDPAIDASAVEHGNTILAAIDGAPNDRQVPMLRAFLVRKIDQLEFAEVDFYDFIAECVTLAGQNMQDVRLAAIEKDLEDTKDNASKGLADFAVDLAMLLALEAAIVLAPAATVSAAAGIMVAAGGVRRARLATRSSSLRAAAEELQLSRYHAGARSQQSWEATIGLIASADRGQLLTDSTESLADRIRSLTIEQRRIDDSIEQLRVADYNDKVKRLLFGDDNPKAKKSPFREFLEPLGAAAQGAAKGELNKRLVVLANDDGRSPAVASPAEADAALPFTITGALSEQLRELRGLKHGAKQEYSALRTFVQYSDDSALSESDEAKLVFQHFTASANHAEMASFNRRETQEAVIVGFEVTLWALWLSRTGALQRTAATTHPASVPPHVGDIFGNTLVEAADPSLPIRSYGPGGSTDASKDWTYTGRTYAGIRRISDFMAHYLFERFAKQYLDLNPADRPFVYDNAELSGAYALPKKSAILGIDNKDRIRLLNLQRAVVITAFAEFLKAQASHTGTGLFSVRATTVADVFFRDPRLVEDQTPMESDGRASAEESSFAAATLGVAGVATEADASRDHNMLIALITEIETMLVLEGLATGVEPAELMADPTILAEIDANFELIEKIEKRARERAQRPDNIAYVALAGLIDDYYRARIDHLKKIFAPTWRFYRESESPQ